MAAPTKDLHRIPGGLRLPAHKSQSTAMGIRDVALPKQLWIPLRQHTGEPALPIVTVGDTVTRGQLIAAAQSGSLGANVHASSSGRVSAIEDRLIPARHAESGQCIVIDCDGKDQAAHNHTAPVDALKLPGTEILRAIEDAGIVGLGGAAFPSAAKMRQGTQQKTKALIINGVECEPFIACDDALMREQADAILRGCRIICHVLDTDRCIIGIESDKPQAWDAIVDAAKDGSDISFKLVQIPTVYPSGGEDQLLYLLTGDEVPSGGLPVDCGYVVHNVGTAYAVSELFERGEPLISRVVTVGGDGIVTPGNYRVRLGTPISEVIAAAGGYTERAEFLIVGGPMTGRAIASDAMPVTKSINCLLVHSTFSAHSAEPERPCIRCDECAMICPVRLQPQELYRFTREHSVNNTARLQEFGIVDCIECGCCDLVCPSHIPLTQAFRVAKHRTRSEQLALQRAERAKHRFTEHKKRLAERELKEQRKIEDKKAGVSAQAIADILNRTGKDPDSD